MVAVKLLVAISLCIFQVHSAAVDEQKRECHEFRHRRLYLSSLIDFE